MQSGMTATIKASSVLQPSAASIGKIIIDNSLRQSSARRAPNDVPVCSTLVPQCGTAGLMN
jgi:hypothetical protein